MNDKLFDPEFFNNRPFFKNLIGLNNLIGVEIGVMGGKNAYNILTHLDIKKLYLVDPYIYYDNIEWESNEHALVGKKAAIKNLIDFKDKIVWLFYKSEEAVNYLEDMVDFVYIDGDHRYKYVKKDIELYSKKVKLDGFLAGHDFKSSEIGVISAVTESLCGFYKEHWDWWRKILEGDVR